MIRHVLLDIDGVLRFFDNSELFALEERNNLPQGALLRIAFSDEHLVPAITGHISDHEWRLRACEELQSQYPKTAKTDFLSVFENTPFRIDYNVLDIVKGIMPDAPLSLATNATSRLQLDLRATTLLDQVDHIFNSSVIGSTKPDANFFSHILHELQLEPQEILFIDDQEKNTAAASLLGINSITYQSEMEIEHIKKDILAIVKNSKV
jgi:putative hydrolase of the HAD superfamily